MMLYLTLHWNQNSAQYVLSELSVYMDTFISNNQLEKLEAARGA